MPGDQTPLMAQIIALADTVDNLYHFEKDKLENRKQITWYIFSRKGRHCVPDLVETRSHHSIQATVNDIR